MSDDQNLDEQNVDQEGPSEAELTAARALGWADKDQWRGKEEDWVDAKEFLRRGTTILPQLKNNLDRTLQRLNTMEGALRAANATIAALQESHDEDVQAQVEAARAELKEEIARASKEGDHDALADATVKLTELNREDAAAASRAKGGKGGEDRGSQPQISPDMLAWQQANADFVQDDVKMAMATAIGRQLRLNGETALGTAFMDKVRTEVEKRLNGPAGGTSKVSAGNGGSGRGAGGGSGGGKTYADLPADAKAACDKMAARLVGANRAHKDIASWRNSYVKQYFSE